mmetsp:Transcript_119907/g.168792  ORF Transcript_119907/g.168792 Transcript_119907/m.168792 type:complete len:190 (-) Transcript_119907:156-725(-)
MKGVVALLAAAIPAIAMACSHIDGKLANGCQCGNNNWNDDDDNAYYTNTCNSGCCYNNQCSNSYKCNDAWWIATIIIVVCCVCGCTAFWYWHSENQKRQAAHYQQMNQNNPSFYDNNAAPPYPGGAAVGDGLNENLLPQSVEVQCPNPSCRLVLQFPQTACGSTVKCGVCSAEFPLAAMTSGYPAASKA